MVVGSEQGPAPGNLDNLRAFVREHGWRALTFDTEMEGVKLSAVELGGQVKSGQSWTGQIRPVAPGRVRLHAAGQECKSPCS
jgi:hypothetical protein